MYDDLLKKYTSMYIDEICQIFKKNELEKEIGEVFTILI
jgi:hypothetical protein